MHPQGEMIHAATTQSVGISSADTPVPRNRNKRFESIMANTTSAPIVEIVPDGDIILVVGSDKKKLLVKSVLLMAVSKPFSVMLGPNWKEGHDMRYHNGPFELTLPEDNATAMEIICSVIHFQNDRIPQILLASDVLAVAIAADKYDCMNALQFASRVWIREQKGKSEDLMLLTAAAYLFGDARAFKEATAALVLNHHGSYLTLAGEDAGSIMPWEVLCKYFSNRVDT